MTLDSALKKVERRFRRHMLCNVCRSGLVDEIDSMLANSYRYSEIIDFAAERGVSLSKPGLSRHNHGHRLGPVAKQLDVIEDPELALKILLSKLVGELRRRSLAKLSTEELLSYSQASTEVLLAMLEAKSRSRTPGK
jgi:hypothetical protein